MRSTAPEKADKQPCWKVDAMLAIARKPSVPGTRGEQFAR